MERKHFSFFLVLIVPAFLLMQMNARQQQTNSQAVVITLTAVPGLQYDQARFAVKPGVQVKLILKNADDMSHNLLITKPGKRLDVVNEAMKLEEKGPAMNYIPKSPEVLWSIPVLAPGQEQSITFTAPKEVGVYPYVCTFPGHGFSMFGAMYVTDDPQLPALGTDPNIPPSRQKSTGDTHSAHLPVNHPYKQEPPYLYRAYMEGSSPASIAVRLTDDLSYCWDAEACTMRYAWDGAFVDNTGLWKGKPNSVAKVLGTIFYRNKGIRNLRIGAGESIPTFKGYRLKDRYPEFHYTIDGVDVYELIKAEEGGNGLLRTFRIPSARENVMFYFDTADGVSYRSSAGKMKNNTIMLSPEEAKEFSIVITKRKEGK